MAFFGRLTDECVNVDQVEQVRVQYLNCSLRTTEQLSTKRCFCVSIAAAGATVTTVTSGWWWWTIAFWLTDNERAVLSLCYEPWACTNYNYSISCGFITANAEYPRKRRGRDRETGKRSHNSLFDSFFSDIFVVKIVFIILISRIMFNFHFSL